MKKSLGLTQKILSRQKKIESRWYKARCAPWGRIKSGEVVYFKDSGEPITIKAEVDKVIQFSDLTPEKIREMLNQYNQVGGLGMDDTRKNFEIFKDKNYCILIFLKNPQKIKPFYIDKSGFGVMSAWISVDDVNKIRREPLR